MYLNIAVSCEVKNEIMLTFNLMINDTKIKIKNIQNVYSKLKIKAKNRERCYFYRLHDEEHNALSTITWLQA